MTITYRIGKSLYVNITNRCPNRCAFCIRNYDNGVGSADSLWLEHEPSADEILRDILKNDLLAFDELVFCGYGEPLERLDDVVFLCKKIREQSDIRIRINTNGQADLIHQKETAPALKGLVDIISISLNAPDAESYQRLCRSDFGENAFDAVLKFTADCKKHIPRVIVSVVDVIPPDEVEK
ncbi:MAG TPA: TIGR04100 family radical SAM protein, partial [Clostridia bacterium]|nr:TIGR04100 family radical SAM protein [Clostridia bacterium]